MDFAQLINVWPIPVENFKSPRPHRVAVCILRGDHLNAPCPTFCNGSGDPPVAQRCVNGLTIPALIMKQGVMLPGYWGLNQPVLAI